MQPLIPDGPTVDDAQQSHGRLLSRARQLNFVGLVAVIFFTVSGGAYGLEPLVGAVGAGWAIALIVVTPLVWSLPIALMVSELASMMPEEGGYYVWVRRGLGDFWGVQEGWWTLSYTAVDMAIYPVLFVNYLAYFLPQLAVDDSGAAAPGVLLARWLIAVAIIALALVINLRGARAVGRSALFNTGVVLTPFVLLVLVGLFKNDGLSDAVVNIKHDLTTQAPSAGLLALGLSTVMWNYMGWDNVSTFAAEVEDAQRNYPRALLTALPLTVTAYLLPVAVGVGVTVDPAVWSETAGWPVLARMLGGSWLGILIAAAALVSAWSLFNSQLLYVSRLPFVMARDGWLPAWLTRTSKRTGVPVTALVVSCAVSAVFALLPFGKLVLIDVLLYAAALLLELFALIRLRLKEPEALRPFRVPGGWFGVALVALLPMLFASIVAVVSFTDEDADPRQAMIVAAVMISGVALYYLRRSGVRLEQSRD